MPLELFRNNFVLHLRAAIGENLARYSERKPFAGRGAPRDQIRLTSALEPCVPLRLELPDGRDLKDLENAKIVHRAFPELTPLQARDPRLWTRLTHVECWDYMRKRWDVDRVVGADSRKEEFLRWRYFLRRHESRALLRNGIARLWWYAHLTHDRNRADPYEWQ